MNKSISPSRTYVAVCSTWDSKGYFFKKFALPDLKQTLGEDKNDSEIAAWFYLNTLDAVSVIEGCFTVEDFAKVSYVQAERIEQSHLVINSDIDPAISAIQMGDAMTSVMQKI